MRSSSVHSRPRAGLTLVELLVVMVLLLILASIALLVVPRVNERRRPAIGAEQVQTALLTAKQRAVRDQAPRGVRIQPIPIILGSRSQVSPAQVGQVVPIECGTSGFTPTFVVQPPPDVLSQYPVGLPWTIASGSRVIVYDVDPLAAGDEELFSNLEVVTVVSAPPPTATTFHARFQRPHQSPAGMRIKVLAYAQELQYIEQPDDYVAQPSNPADLHPSKVRPAFVPDPGRAAPDPLAPVLNPARGINPLRTVVLQAFNPMPPGPTPGDFTGGNHFITPPGSATNPFPRNNELWPVQPGDFIEIRGGGPMQRISSITHRDPPILVDGSGPQQYDGDVLIVDGVFPFPVPETRDYRIVRAPRVLQSEPIIKLPKDVAIDLQTNFVYQGYPYAGQLPIDPATGHIDILFAPTGGVISRGLGSDRVNLWIRDITQDTIVLGSSPPQASQFEQTLVIAYRQTGFIAAFPVDTTPNGSLYASPYNLVRSGAHTGGL